MSRLKLKNAPLTEEQNDFAEHLAGDIAQEFDKWIRPELSKVIGQEAVDKIRDADFDSVLKAQFAMLYINRSVTYKKTGATFHFQLRQGGAEKYIILSKWKYDADFTKGE
jgi:hypothetical protein